jgi:lipid A disaccharide synthetase
MSDDLQRIFRLSKSICSGAVGDNADQCQFLAIAGHGELRTVVFPESFYGTIAECLPVIVAMSSVDILILSNGPGEVSTWVRPVVKALRERLPDHQQTRISVVLSPCANASGHEAEMARRFPEVDRVQAASHFFPFLVWGKTADQWDWHPQGVVIFLGGDQFYPLVIGKRLGYRTVIYAEWDARWHRWIDRFACMKPEIIGAAPVRFRHKCEVIGDLMADVGTDDKTAQAVREVLALSPEEELIGLMPGSKKNKLSLGIPFLLSAAEHIHRQRPQTRFVIPVAPTLSLEQLASFADATHNPDMGLFPDAPMAELINQQTSLPKLKTSNGVEVLLWPTHPAYDVMSQFKLCLTTVGANTAELGSLGVPMIVLLPTQKLTAMKAWDGIPGIVANLPGVGDPFVRLFNGLVLKQIYQEGRLFAWPNIWAKREIVPELIGQLQPAQVAEQVVDYLAHPEKLQAIQRDLRTVRGSSGAAGKLADMVWEELKKEDGFSTPFPQLKGRSL